ncbi:MAG: hypothetical protein EOO43_13980 [Flavobacterium sp.]|nr:MAG: hypothetical protein EOO43_13980 [Flavobacterium sp.]
MHAHAVKAQIHLVGIIEPENLPAYASNFDVGLALELTVPENRDICLTNKVFTYLLAGNAIISSETEMQKIFNEEFRSGVTYPINDVKLLIEKINKFKESSVLRQQRLHNYNLGKNHLNWENESTKLLNRLTAN